VKNWVFPGNNNSHKKTLKEKVEKVAVDSLPENSAITEPPYLCAVLCG